MNISIEEQLGEAGKVSTLEPPNIEQFKHKAGFRKTRRQALAGSAGVAMLVAGFVVFSDGNSDTNLVATAPETSNSAAASETPNSATENVGGVDQTKTFVVLFDDTGTADELKAHKQNFVNDLLQLSKGKNYEFVNPDLPEEVSVPEKEEDEILAPDTIEDIGNSFVLTLDDEWTQQEIEDLKKSLLSSEGITEIQTSANN